MERLGRKFGGWRPGQNRDTERTPKTELRPSRGFVRYTARPSPSQRLAAPNLGACAGFGRRVGLPIQDPRLSPSRMFTAPAGAGGGPDADRTSGRSSRATSPERIGSGLTPARCHSRDLARDRSGGAFEPGPLLGGEGGRAGGASPASLPGRARRRGGGARGRRRVRGVGPPWLGPSPCLAPALRWPRWTVIHSIRISTAALSRLGAGGPDPWIVGPSDPRGSGAQVPRDRRTRHSGVLVRRSPGAPVPRDPGAEGRRRRGTWVPRGASRCRADRGRSERGRTGVKRSGAASTGASTRPSGIRGSSRPGVPSSQRVLPGVGRE